MGHTTNPYCCGPIIITLAEPALAGLHSRSQLVLFSDTGGELG